MNENVDSKNEENIMKDNQDIVALIKKMQNKLDLMEEKIDSLILQSRPKTFKERQFSKPYKEYDKTRRPSVRKYEGKKEESSGEGKFYHGSPFGKKKESGKSNFKGTKKPFRKTK
ncbi:MAG: hypothetical protein KKD07_08295 [Candidatus Omnitrophica bacterium]|nr:hypothetical protein [Candidatus Omnitrophota bacterium]MBU1996667.1 hypothetical protein [Candidatus Omnitrophota bacterium]MBU4334423.1 hypothetical protein [Candidatus Omnitrophota bacterium]